MKAIKAHSTWSSLVAKLPGTQCETRTACQASTVKACGRLENPTAAGSPSYRMQYNNIMLINTT